MLSCSRCGRLWCTASAIHDTLQPCQSALVGKDTGLPQAAGEGRNLLTLLDSHPIPAETFKPVPRCLLVRELFGKFK